MSKQYNRIGVTYAQTRKEDPRIEQLIEEALGDAKTIVNVGAGTGSYEPKDRDVTAVEPSEKMIAQRPVGSAVAVCASAESLPFDDKSFDAAMAVLTLHHWSEQKKGLLELKRVARNVSSSLPLTLTLAHGRRVTSRSLRSSMRRRCRPSKVLRGSLARAKLASSPSLMTVRTAFYIRTGVDPRHIFRMDCDLAVHPSGRLAMSRRGSAI